MSVTLCNLSITREYFLLSLVHSAEPEWPSILSITLTLTLTLDLFQQPQSIIATVLTTTWVIGLLLLSGNHWYHCHKFILLAIRRSGFCHLLSNYMLQCWLWPTVEEKWTFLLIRASWNSTHFTKTYDKCHCNLLKPWRKIMTQLCCCSASESRTSRACCTVFLSKKYQKDDLCEKLLFILQCNWGCHKFSSKLACQALFPISSVLWFSLLRLGIGDQRNVIYDDSLFKQCVIKIILSLAGFLCGIFAQEDGQTVLWFFWQCNWGGGTLWIHHGLRLQLRLREGLFYILARICARINDRNTTPAGCQHPSWPKKGPGKDGAM